MNNITKFTADAKWRDNVLKKFKVCEVTYFQQDLNDSSSLGARDGQKISNLMVALVVV